MIFLNVNNLSVVTDFEKLYGLQLCNSYPELTSTQIKIYTDKLGDGWIKNWDSSNDSPYTSNHAINEIMRSDEIYNKCCFSREEEFAILAHELGHIVIGKKGLKIMNNLQEEKEADRLAVSLGLKEPLKIAIQKMIDHNINPQKNAEMTQRKDAL